MRRNLLWALISLFLPLTALQGQNGAPADPASGVGFSVLYNFTGGEDGCCLYGGLARDRRGSLFGVTYIDDNGSGPGNLFKLARRDGGYTLEILHGFSFGDGLCMTTPVLDAAGNLFGVCTDVGTAYGTLWEYSDDGRFSVLHTFNGTTDGMEPEDTVALDGNGNIYGTAYTSGAGGAGTLWEYSRSSQTFVVLHAFSNGNDGGLLPAGPTIDSFGRLWGTTEYGPNCYYCGTGTVWSYDPVSGAFSTVLDFGSSGVNAPQSRLAIDDDGNLYGTAFGLTIGNCGLVYELQKSNNYAPIILHSFTGNNGDGCYPYGNVALDQRRNLLGTTYNGGDLGDGAVYELIPKDSGWQEITLHSFTLSDGYRPQSGLIHLADSWFGTASSGGNYGEGVIFELSGVH
ncbi:MAG TPA: choice-of-anchor tandem repeat GloVer-containing protein [Terriglobales bacterium]|nr:choice-of-anchor tandem repeat GloVer-containing protein [Terriglobales bacterium]